MKRLKPRVLEKNIETIAKKLNVFTLDDLEVLTEKRKVELLSTIENLIQKKRIKKEKEAYIYIPQIRKSKENSDTDLDSLIHSLPFTFKKPKEIYLRNINNIPGFVDYFFAPKHIKDKIKNIFKVLKEAHSLKGKKLQEVLKKNNMSLERYNKYKEEITKNGLVNLVGNKTKEPGEIFYFFKEYYLSPQKLTAETARELAIQRFEKLIKMQLNRGMITRADTMQKWLKKEYSTGQIEKFREYNFSEFDTEKMFKE